MDRLGTQGVAQGASSQSSSSTFQLISQIATEKQTRQERILEPTLEHQTQIDIHKMLAFFHEFFFTLFYDIMTFGNYELTLLVYKKLLKLFLITRNLK